MATLLKRPGSRFWYAAYRIPLVDSGGKRQWQLVRTVTKETDRSKAQRAADLMEDHALKEAGAGNEGSKLILGILREAADAAAKRRLTVDLGRDFLRRMIAHSTGEELKVWSVREWLNEWLSQRATTAKPATHKRYKHSTSAFLLHLGEVADLPVEQLNVQHLRVFRDKLHQQGRAAKTANGYTKDVGMALQAAVEEGILQRSPSKRLKKLPEDDSVEREPFSLDEVKKLVQAAPSEEWRGVILLGAFGGLRIGDAATIKVDSLDLKNRMISFVPQKSSRRKNSGITLPMHPELVAFFKKFPLSTTAGAPCFPSLSSLTVGGHWGLSTKFAGVMAKAGVSRGGGRIHVEGEAGRSVYSRSFHSLRHGFNSWMLNAGVSQETRQELVGHADKKTNAEYSHHEIETLRAAVGAVPGFAKKRKIRSKKGRLGLLHGQPGK